MPAGVPSEALLTFWHHHQEGSRMLLDGVSVHDRIVRELAAQVQRPLRERLFQALFFSSEVVALTPAERAEVIAALERMPLEYEEVREGFLATRAGVL